MAAVTAMNEVDVNFTNLATLESGSISPKPGYSRGQPAWIVPYLVSPMDQLA